MKEETVKLLEKAERATVAAEVLLGAGHAEFSVGRAYYAMFHAAEALLHEKGLHASKHGGVHALFGEHFAKTGLFDVKYHRWLLGAFDRRLVGDYGFDAVLTEAEAARTIDQARELLAKVRDFLSPRTEEGEARRR